MYNLATLQNCIVWYGFTKTHFGVYRKTSSKAKIINNYYFLLDKRVVAVVSLYPYLQIHINYYQTTKSP